MGDLTSDPTPLPPPLPAADVAADAFHEEALAEMDRLQNRRASWTQTLLVLAVSLALFMAAGTFQWDRSFLLLIIPVLFFHELGHYVAMRAVGYTNLRMFFIPLFGAAVSGQHYNVSAWKRVMVALAGPVPGIVVGAVMAILSVWYGNDTLHQVAMLMLILNGFNLLPLLPLDGGHVVRAILFSRHPLLDIGFRTVAAIILIVGSLLLGDKLLIVVGAFMLLGVPLAYQLAKIVAELRAEGMSGASPDAKTIPRETAVQIIDRVHRAIPKLNAKQVAPHSLSIFQDLNARPPGVGASLGLGSVHAVAFIAAAVFAVGLFVAQVTRAPGFLDQLAGSPRYALDENAMVLPAEPPVPAATLLVATFNDIDSAQAEFRTNSIGSPPNAQSLFGCSIFVAFPQPLPTGSGMPEGPAAASFVAIQGQDEIVVRIQCFAPDEAAASFIHAKLVAYGLREITEAPWTPHRTSATMPAEPKASVYETRNILPTTGGGSLTIQFVADDPHHVAPAMTRWLAFQGCHSFHYDIGKRKRSPK